MTKNSFIRANQLQALIETTTIALSAFEVMMEQKEDRPQETELDDLLYGFYISRNRADRPVVNLGRYEGNRILLSNIIQCLRNQLNGFIREFDNL